MKILEIDSDASSIAGYMIEALQSESKDSQHPRFQQFDLAGSDNSVLAALQKRFHLPPGRVALKDVDIQALNPDVRDQYDMIVFNQVPLYPINTHIAANTAKAITDDAARKSSLSKTRSMMKR